MSNASWNILLLRWCYQVTYKMVLSTIPYESDHPRHIHANIPYNALLRAARLYSTVEDFHMERLSTEMILLVNGYPPNFIKYHIKRFFTKHNTMSAWMELDNETYQQLHQQLLYKLTRREDERKAMSNNHRIP
jgi:hypothetical protein